MTTFLAQNQFMTSVDVSPPASTEKPAVAPSPGKGDATAEPIKVSDACEGNCSNAGGSKTADGGIRETAVTDLGRAVTAGLSHNPITQAVEVRDSGATNYKFLGDGNTVGRTGDAVADAVNGTETSGMDVTARRDEHLHIAHLIHHAGQKHPDEDEVLYLLLKLHDKPGTRDLPEIPDAEALLNEIDPPFLHFLRSKMSAPRLPCDQVWADEPPIFLKSVS